MANLVLYVIKAQRYNSRVIEIVSEYKGKNIVYLTTNKSNCSLLDEFEKGGVDRSKLLFIDCISKQFQGPLCAEKCVMIDGPQSLTHISIAIDESIKNLGKNTVVVIDSLSVFLIYNDSATLSRFMNFLLNKLRNEGVDVAILVVDSDMDKDAVKQVTALVDEVRESDF